MPYIHEQARSFVDRTLDPLLTMLRAEPVDETLDGTLNYIVSRIVAAAFEPMDQQKWRYHNVARAVAVFECAKLEFYRRIGEPKEEEAIGKNGDIPEYRPMRETYA